MWWIIGFGTPLLYWMCGVITASLVIKYNDTYDSGILNWLVVLWWPFILALWMVQYAPCYVYHRWLKNTKANQ